MRVSVFWIEYADSSYPSFGKFFLLWLLLRIIFIIGVIHIMFSLIVSAAISSIPTDFLFCSESIARYISFFVTGRAIYVADVNPMSVRRYLVSREFCHLSMSFLSVYPNFWIQRFDTGRIQVFCRIRHVVVASLFARYLGARLFYFTFYL